MPLSSSSSLATVPWPILALGASLAFVALIAFLLYGLGKAAINKTEARDVPEVLTAMAELVRSFTRPLGKAMTPLQGPLGSSTAAPDPAGMDQTSQQGIGGTEVAQ